MSAIAAFGESADSELTRVLRVQLHVSAPALEA